MAVTVGELVVKLGGDVRGFAQTFAKAGKVIGGLGIGLAFATKKVFDLGASVAETQSKFTTVFGAATDDAQKFLNDFANMAGLSASQGQDVLATTAAIAQGMGFAQAASSKFAQEVVTLAADIGSFNNLPTADTLNRITAALTGERESLKRLGIVILETDVQERAFINTGKTSVKQLTQQEKATATLQLVTEKAGVAVGDLGRTQDSAANQARFLGAAFFTVAENVAVTLLPVLQAELIPALKNVLQHVQDNAEKLARFGFVAVAVSKVVISTLVVAFKTAGETIGNMGVVLLGLVTGNMQLMRFALAELAKDTLGNVGLMLDAWNRLGEGISTALSKSIKVPTVGGGGRKGLPPVLQDTLKGMEQTIEEFMENTGVEAGRLLIRGMMDGMRDFSDKMERFLKSFIEDLIIFKLKKVLGLGSPSKVTALMGRQIVQGLQMGMKSMSNELAQTASAIAGTPLTPFMAVAGGVGGSQFNINADFSKIPAALTPREAALNREWQAVVREVILQLRQSGFRG